MSIATSDVREDAQAPDPAEERDPEPEAEEPQRTEGNEKDNEQTNKWEPIREIQWVLWFWESILGQRIWRMWLGGRGV